MQIALALAERGLGDVWPNPAVGCVIVNEGYLVGRGWTQSGGRPHAETEALKQAGDRARGATAYVSLEPCSHHGQTPPCAEALVRAGVTKVVAATVDPDPRVSGRGLAMLRAAKIDVVEGVLKAEADRLNAGFFLRVKEKRPLFALKVAASLDGRIALKSGESKWITGALARSTGHAIRARFDAVLAGSETVLKDKPTLNCRVPGYAGRPKTRVVLDRRGRAGNILSAADGPVMVLTSELADAAKNMAEKGLTRVLIEGGGAVAASFLKAGLVDEIYWFSAPSVFGGESVPAIGTLGLDQLPQAAQFRVRDTMTLGDDRLTLLTKRA